MEEVRDIIQLYHNIYKHVLSIPTIIGKKTEKERFAGADCTYTVEAYIPGTKKAIQAATAHCLGQNFSKIFNIKFQKKDTSHEHAWQNSWGFTTRSIGIMLMVHGDDAGIVFPPKIAPIQIVIVPIIFKKKTKEVMEYVKDIEGMLTKQGYRVHVDDRQSIKPGKKYNYWELMGVPIRLEIGPRDMKKQSVVVCRRDMGKKSILTKDHIANGDILTVVSHMQKDMYTKAHEKMINNIVSPKIKDEMCEYIKEKKMCLIAHCGHTECEEDIKANAGAKALCIPDKQLEVNGSCAWCGKPAKHKCLFGLSY